MLLLLMRECDITASAYNAAATPATTAATANAYIATMLIIRCDNAYKQWNAYYEMQQSL